MDVSSIFSEAVAAAKNAATAPTKYATRHIIRVFGDRRWAETITTDAKAIGFAYVVVKPFNAEFFTFLQSHNVGFLRDTEWVIPMSFITHNVRGLGAAEAAAKAFASVLANYCITSYVESEGNIK